MRTWILALALLLIAPAAQAGHHKKKSHRATTTAKVSASGKARQEKERADDARAQADIAELRGPTRPAAVAHQAAAVPQADDNEVPGTRK